MTSRERMQEAMEALGPDRFILSPVDIAGGCGVRWKRLPGPRESRAERTAQEQAGDEGYRSAEPPSRSA